VRGWNSNRINSVGRVGRIGITTIAGNSAAPGPGLVAMLPRAQAALTL